MSTDTGVKSIAATSASRPSFIGSGSFTSPSPSPLPSSSSLAWSESCSNVWLFLIHPTREGQGGAATWRHEKNPSADHVLVVHRQQKCHRLYHGTRTYLHRQAGRKPRDTNVSKKARERKEDTWRENVRPRIDLENMSATGVCLCKTNTGVLAVYGEVHGISYDNSLNFNYFGCGGIVALTLQDIHTREDLQTQPHFATRLPRVWWTPTVKLTRRSACSDPLHRQGLLPRTRDERPYFQHLPCRSQQTTGPSASCDSGNTKPHTVR